MSPNSNSPVPFLGRQTFGNFNRFGVLRFTEGLPPRNHDNERGAMPHRNAFDPTRRNGRVVGLLGGSFDPPHDGHVQMTRHALTRFGLDEVWWLVSPGNPLKQRGPQPLDRRMAAARSIMRHPRVTITDLEARIGTRYTAQTLRWLLTRHRQERFVWLMGADNLAQFHRWQDWRWIIENVPVGVVARPGERMSARLSVAAKIYAASRLPAAASHRLGQGDAPRWCFINMPMRDDSSTALRAAGQWPA